ncbi:MAG: response regulator [Melioribacteraceae bacterium]|nr:response regulator [Melioribacteraceae bacterium]
MGTAIQKPKLLITEDDYENQKFLNLFLKKYFAIDMCDSSETFYAHINNEQYDIILMDISIKGKKNGLDLTREMRQNPKYLDTPIICYTAHAYNIDRLNALDAGCDIYISKPSDIKYLLKSMFQLLESKGKILYGNGISESECYCTS